MIDTTASTPASTSTSSSGKGWRVFLNTAAIIGAAAVVIALFAAIIGARVLIFSSGSMAPAIPEGSAAMTIPRDTDELQVGDVISVPRAGDGKLVTHRIVDLTVRDGLTLATLKGDANPAADAAPYALGAQTQTVAFAIPHAGAALAVMKSPWFLGAVVALVVLAAIPTRPPSRKKTEHTKAESPRTEQGREA